MFAAAIPAIASIASGVASSSKTGGAGGSGMASTGPTYVTGSPIHIAPVGVNVGEILKQFVGPPENGGFGLNFDMSGYGMRSSTGATITAPGNGGFRISGGMLALAAAAGIGGLLLWKVL